MRHRRILSLIPIALVALGLSAYASSHDAVQSPGSLTSGPTVASRPAPPPSRPLEPSSPRTAGSQLPSLAPTAGPAPAPVPIPGPPSVPAEEAVQGLITRNAVWHAPASLHEGQTDNIALSIGDAQRLRDMINATVPDDVPRSPLPVDLDGRDGRAGEVDRDLLGCDGHATADIDKSIGEGGQPPFSWQVQPHVSGDLELQAFITCPREDGSVTTETCHSDDYRAPLG